MSRQQRRAAKEAQKFHDRLVLKFLEKYVEVNYQEGQELTDRFGELERQWRYYCNKHLIKDGKELFGKTIDKLLKTAAAQKVFAALEGVKVNDKQMEGALAIPIK